MSPNSVHNIIDPARVLSFDFVIRLHNSGHTAHSRIQSHEPLFLYAWVHNCDYAKINQIKNQVPPLAVRRHGPTTKATTINGPCLSVPLCLCQSNFYCCQHNEKLLPSMRAGNTVPVPGLFISNVYRG